MHIADKLKNTASIEIFFLHSTHPHSLCSASPPPSSSSSSSSCYSLAVVKLFNIPRSMRFLRAVTRILNTLATISYFSFNFATVCTERIYPVLLCAAHISHNKLLYFNLLFYIRISFFSPILIVIILIRPFPKCCTSQDRIYIITVTSRRCSHDAKRPTGIN